MWVALVASGICIGVMFLINWWAALITIALVTALYMYVKYTKPGKSFNFGYLKVTKKGFYFFFRPRNQSLECSPSMMSHVTLWKGAILRVFSNLGNLVYPWENFCLSGIARTFPVGQAAYPGDQIVEENEEKLRKMGENNRRMRKCSSLAHPRLRVWLHPCSVCILISDDRLPCTGCKD